MTYLTRLTSQIPAPLRNAWRAFGPFIALALAVLALWLTNGEYLIRNFSNVMAQLDADPEAIRHGSLYRFGYYTGFWIAQLVKAPLQVMAWLGFTWSLGAVTQCISFRWPSYFSANASALKISPWVNVALIILSIWLNLNFVFEVWIGPNDVNGAVKSWILGWCLVYTVWHYFRDTREARRQLIETATQAELTALKAQINPHFLFNSLNNIFGTALTEGGQRTPEGVQQLSGLLRYQLEKTQVEQVEVATELRFLADYVQFHRQLLPNAVVHQYEWDGQPARLAPLLLTPLVDYALQQRRANPSAPVESRLTVKDRFLSYRLTYPVGANPPATEALDNVRQRLGTLYPEQYSFREAGGTLALTINLLS